MVTNLANLAGFGLLCLVMFAFGYGCAVWRRSKKKPKPGDFESELASLEEQSPKMLATVLRVLKATNVPKKLVSDRTGEMRTECNPNKWDRFKAWLSRILSKSRPEETSISSRIRKLETEATDFRKWLDYVSECFENTTRTPLPPIAQTESNNLPLSTQPVTPDIKPPVVKSDSVYSDLFGAGDSKLAQALPDIDNVSETDGQFPKIRLANQQTSRPLSRAPTAEAILELYNRAVLQISVREEFRETYQPVRIGTVNAEERTRNPTIQSEFRQTTDGDFFALPIQGTDKYSVLPRLGLTIEAVSYGAGAVGQVFSKTPNYDPKLFYSRYAVRIPARFRKVGERWDLIDPGELDLGHPD